MAFLFPPMYLYFWKKCTELVSGTRGFPKFALGIPRGHAKTMFLKLLIVFIILFTQRKFILVIAASEGLAESILSDVIDILDSGNIRRIFGNWDDNVEYNRHTAKSFYFRGRHIIMKAKGQGASMRGIAEKFQRPDVMIFDDAQTAECAASPEQALKFIEWMRGTAMKAKDPTFCFYLYVGNMYKKLLVKAPTRETAAVYGCQLRNLKEDPDWESLIVGAILADGTALWEDLQPLSQLLKEYAADKRAGTEAVFLAEVQNDDEAYNSNMFDQTKVPICPYNDHVMPQGEFLVIDPSLGKKKSDDQIVTRVIVIDGFPIIREIRKMQVSAPKLVQAVLDWAITDGIPCIAVESYAYQASLCQWLDHFLEELGISEIAIVEITRGAKSKVSAILSAFKEVEDGDVLLHNSVRSLVFSEARNYDPLATDNIDNIWDTIAYTPMIALQYREEIKVYLRNLVATTSLNADRVVDHGLQWGA